MRSFSLLFGLVGCGSPVAQKDPGTDSQAKPVGTMQSLRTKHHSDGTYLTMSMLVTDADGVAVPCGTGSLEMAVRYSFDDGRSWTELPDSDADYSCMSSGQGDVGMVVDMSGSESGYESEMEKGATAMYSKVMEAGGQASLVRVSTESTVRSPLSGDPTAFAEALDGAVWDDHDAGWTALWDGLRMANETLASTPQVSGESLDSFCNSAGKLGVVGFTDGMDNNSADQEAYDHSAYPGDGIDTVVADLYGMQAGGASTPYYMIGLGNDVDDAALQGLAEQTNGRYLPIETPDQISDVYGVISDYFDSRYQICADVPDAPCGRGTFEVDWSWTEGGEVLHGTQTFDTVVDCPVDPRGRMTTILLTLSNPRMGEGVGEKLAAQTVDWSVPTPRAADPEVLVILDDNNHLEFSNDAEFVANTLMDDGYSVTYVDEPTNGLTYADMEGYDVVWFSNPGYPPDDLSTVQALQQFSHAGGGVVMQGDDMAWSWGASFDMSDMTRLNFQDNGVSFCGVWTNDNAGSSYEVRIVDDTHPVTSGLGGETFLYGDDIDTTTPVGLGENVLAWANLEGGSHCADVPVIVTYDP